MPLSEVKMKLSELVADVFRRDEEITITKNGSPAAVLISPEEFESWRETLTIRKDKALMKEIQKGLKALKRTKKMMTLKELFRS